MSDPRGGPMRGLLCGLCVMLLATLVGCSEDSSTPIVTPQEDMGEDALIEPRDVADEEDVATPDVVEDTGGADTEDTGEDEPDQADDCECAEGEVCVSNDTVTDTCYPRDCRDEQCDAEEICFQGQCVAQSCAGLDCGDYPNVCRGGQCVVGSCSDPDVACPDGLECIQDECRQPCQVQPDCGDLACIDGYCGACAESAECGADLVCFAEQCVPSCVEDPSRCQEGEVCQPDSGQCVPGCSGDGDCENGQVCDLEENLCVDRECTEEGVQGECAEAQICLNGRCQYASPVFFGDLCSGCGTASSGQFRLIGVVAPVPVLDSVSVSPRYRLQSGTLRILQERE